MCCCCKLRVGSSISIAIAIIHLMITIAMTGLFFFHYSTFESTKSFSSIFNMDTFYYTELNWTLSMSLCQLAMIGSNCILLAGLIKDNVSLVLQWLILDFFTSLLLVIYTLGYTTHGHYVDIDVFCSTYLGVKYILGPIIYSYYNVIWERKESNRLQEISAKETITYFCQLRVDGCEAIALGVINLIITVGCFIGFAIVFHESLTRRIQTSYGDYNSPDFRMLIRAIYHLVMIISVSLLVAGLIKKNVSFILQWFFFEFLSMVLMFISGYGVIYFGVKYIITSVIYSYYNVLCEQKDTNRFINPTTNMNVIVSPNMNINLNQGMNPNLNLNTNSYMNPNLNSNMSPNLNSNTNSYPVMYPHQNLNMSPNPMSNMNTYNMISATNSNLSSDMIPNLNSDMNPNLNSDMNPNLNKPIQDSETAALLKNMILQPQE